MGNGELALRSSGYHSGAVAQALKKSGRKELEILNVSRVRTGAA